MEPQVTFRARSSFRVLTSLADMRRFPFIILAVVGLVFVSTALATQPVDFDRDIRPILSNKCFACHGPDDGKLQAGLRLDEEKIATHPLDSGSTAIVPGQPEDSELVRRITSSDEGE